MRAGRWLGVLLGVLGAVSGCERAIPDKGQDTPPVSPETLKLGLVTVLAEGFGESPLIDALAVDLAVTQVNAAGGVLGRSVEVVVGDFGGDLGDVAGVVQDLLDQGVVGLLASETTDVTLETARLAAKAGVPQLSCCATGTGLRDEDFGGFLFRTAPADDLQARAVVKVAASDAVTSGAGDGIKRGAVIYIDNGYGVPFRENLAANLAKGLELVAEVPVPESPSSRDISDTITRVQEAVAGPGGVDFIVLIAFEDSGAELVNAWYRQGGQPVFWIPTDGVYTPRFVSLIADASPQAFDTMMGTAPSAIPASANYVYFRDTYLATYGREPLAFAAHQYDAAVLLLLAIEAAGTTDGAAVRDALLAVSRGDGDGATLFRPSQIANALEAVAHGKAIDFDGASGDVNFDDQGDVVSGYALWEVVKEGDGYVYRTASYIDGQELGNRP